ncbi:hypothetical protein [Kitasatospora sp. NPDC057223]|uniref:hypothetical protein n=1 Tax=Kitasatospora sp. NPDC057223 TaxID=3346055 RepID=UPI0036315356
MIAGLDDAFAAVPRPQAIAACPCGNCGWADDVGVLLGKPRARLTAGELMFYAGAVLNTVGGAQDFRYFAPRILGLVLSGEMSHPGIQLVFVKLREARWWSWPEAAFLAELFDAVWAEVLEGDDSADTAGSVLCALAGATDSVAGRLAAWSVLGTPAGIRHLHDFAVGEVHRSGGRLVPRDAFWNADSAAYAEVVDWLNGGSALAAIEAAFERTVDDELLDLLVAAHEALSGP